MEAKYPSLKGENIVIVGVGGIGGAIAKEFLEQGSRVHAIDKKPLEELEKVWKEFQGPIIPEEYQKPSYGDREKIIYEDSELFYYKCDVTDYEKYSKLLKEIGEEYYPIKSLIYTAGIGQATKIGEMDHRERDRKIEEYLDKVNVQGFRDALNIISNYMKEGSSIIAISSINAYRPEYDMAAYDSTKAALTQYAISAALRLGERGIRVNVVAPGYVRTPQTIEELKNPETREIIEKHTVLGRVAEPKDIAPIVVALTSKDFEFVTGAVIEVSGGLALAQYPPIKKQKQVI